jgi:hypothetical protein
MPSTEHQQPNRLLSPGHADHNAGSTSTEADLLSIQRDFPAFRIWREITGDRTRFVARRRRPGTRPHTVVTSDTRELRSVLAENSQPAPHALSSAEPGRTTGSR